MAVGVDNVKQADNVGVSQFLEKGDFSDSSAGDTFVFGFEANLFKGDYAAAIGKVTRLVDNTIRAWLSQSIVLTMAGSSNSCHSSLAAAIVPPSQCNS